MAKNETGTGTFHPAYEGILDRLRKYRANRAAVPEEALLSSYAAAYEKLKEEIKADCDRVFRDAATCGMKFDMDPWCDGATDEEFVRFRAAFGTAYRATRRQGFPGALYRIALEEEIPVPGSTAGEVLAHARAAFDRILRAAYEAVEIPFFYTAYGPYWVSHCSRDAEGGAWSNDLVGMEYDVETGMWYGLEGGRPFFAAYLPPTEEMVAERAEGIRKAGAAGRTA